MADQVNKITIASKYQALEYLHMPVALTDKWFNLLHYNSAFRQLIITTDNVFPSTDLNEVFINFEQRHELKDFELKGVSFVMLPSVKHKETGNVYDLHMSLIDSKLEHIEGYTITCFPVEERDKSREDIAELGEHHLRLLEVTNTGVVIHRNNIIVYANRRAAEITGAADSDNLIGKEIWQFISKNFKAVVADRIVDLTQKKTAVIPIEEKFVKLDDTLVDVEVFAFPVIYEGQFAIKTIFTDISDRKTAQQSLLDTKQQYFTLVENLSDVVFQTDVDAQFCYLNSSWEKLTGFTIDETISKSCFNFLHHPQNTDIFYQKIRKLLLYGIQDFKYDLLLSTKSGDTKFVEVSLKPIYNQQKQITGINGLIRDIHSKKIADLEVHRIQKTLKHHQTVLVSLTREVSIIKGDIDKALKHIAHVTTKTLQVSGIHFYEFNNDQSVLTSIFNFDTEQKVHGKQITFTSENVPHFFNTLLHKRILIADDVEHVESLIELKSLQLLDDKIVSTMFVTFGNSEKLIGVIAVENKLQQHIWTLEDQSFVRSIADFISLAYESNLLKKTQLELIESENLYRTLVEQATDAIIIVDKNNRFVEVNEGMCELSGYTHEELLQMSYDKLVSKNSEEKPSGKLFNIGISQRFIGERKFIHKSGEERIAEVSANVFPDGRIQAIARDITDRKNQEKALQESELRLEMALKGADLGTWDFYIPENRMVHNKRWSEMLGYYFENTTVNLEFGEKLLHPDDIAAAKQAFNDHLIGKTQFYEATIRMLSSTGEWKWILDKGRVVEWDVEGKPMRVSGIHQDVTLLLIQEQQLLNQKKFLQEIVNAIPNLIYVKNINNEFVTVNNALTEFLGTTSDELLRYKGNKEQTYTDSLNVLFKNDSDVFINKKPVVVGEQKLKNKHNGKTYWVQSIKLPLKDDDGNFTEILSVTMNITEIKTKENELNLLNDKLELKVNERTAMLESANKELETFNYSVSHDLRTPLRSIDIFAYFLEKNHKQILDKDGIENIKQIRSSIVKMGNLIDNLLIFSKIGRWDKKSDIINTKEIIEEVVQELGERQDLSNYKIIYNTLPNIRGDYKMFKQAFTNLISNAIKFTKLKKKPQIEFIGLEDDNSITIGIKDNGVGFSMEFKDKLFKALKRLHSDEQFEGSGIGLAIVERIIKRHEGTIWAESAEHKGTTFYFSLPKGE